MWYGTVAVIVLMILVLNIWFSKRMGKQIKTTMCSTNQRGAIVMYCTKDTLTSFPKYVIAINKMYAERQGYDFILKTDPYEENIVPAWNKVAMIREVLPRYDWVFYIDWDAIFHIPHHEVRIECFMDQTHHMFVCSDEANSMGKSPINAGTLLIKNTAEMMELLSDWWDLRHHQIYGEEFAYEQMAIGDAYKGKIKLIRHVDKIKVYPENVFNSASAEVLAAVALNQMPSTFIIHYMATSTEQRNKIFEAYAKKYGVSVV